MNRRQLGGRRAKTLGDLFERMLFFASSMESLNLIQIPMGAKVVGKSKVVKLPSPFDFILQKMGESPVFFDAKTKNSDSMAYSDFFDDGSTQRQLLTLLTATKFGTKSGFIIWFRKSDRIIFVDALKVGTMEPRSSIGTDDGTDLGSSSHFQLSHLWPTDGT